MKATTKRRGRRAGAGRPPKLTPEAIETARVWIEEGATLADAARSLGVSDRTLRNHGLKGQPKRVRHVSPYWLPGSTEMADEFDIPAALRDEFYRKVFMDR